MGTVIGFALLFILSIVALIVSFKASNLQDRHISRIVGIGAFFVSFLILGLGCYTIIDPGHRGVQVTLGNMNMTPLEEGFQFINPVCSVDEYSVQMHKTKVRYLAISKDTQEVEIEFVFNWRPEPSKLCYLIKENTTEFAEVLFETAATESVKADIVKYPISEIADKRPVIKTAVQGTLTTWLGKYGIIIMEASITDIDFSDEYNNAIERKQIQEQKALEESNILAQIKVIAEQAKAEAGGKADAAIESARGKAKAVEVNAAAEAKAVEIRAEAEATAVRLVSTEQAEANKRIALTLTDELLRRIYLQEWDGILPRFLMGGGEEMSVILPPEVVNGK